MSLRKLFSGIYKRCGCGHCDCLIPFITKEGKFARFKNGHNSYLRKGDKNPLYKGGRTKSGKYWKLLMPDYISSNKEGYVREHIYFYEQYHKLCMLDWGDVHHIDCNPDNNMPWNLMGLTHTQHISITKKIDMSNRKCSRCDSNTTYANKKGWLNWFRDGKGGWLCKLCKDSDYRLEKRLI